MHKDDLRKTEFYIREILNKEGISNISKLDMTSIIFASILYKGDHGFIKEIEDSDLQFQIKLTYSKYEKVIKTIKGSITDNYLKRFLFTQYELDSRFESNNLLTDGLSKLFVELLDVDENDKIADLDMNDFSKLKYIIDEKKYKRLDGYEINMENVLICKIKNYILNNEVNIIESNVFKEKIGKKYNKILAPSRLAFRLSLEQIQKFEELYPKLSERIMKNRSEWADLLIALDLLETNGRIVKLMTLSNLTSSAPFEKNIRKYIVDEKYLETVIALPTGLLNGTGIGSALIVLSENNNKVNFINATEIYTNINRIEKKLSEKDINKILNLIGKDTEESVLVERDKILDKDYILDPKRYLNEISFKNEIKLEEVLLDINRGSNITNKKLERYTSKIKTKYRFLNLADIQDGRIKNTATSLKKNLVESNEEFSDMKKLKDLQLLISRTGSPIRIAVVENLEEETWFYSGNIYAITIDKDKYNPYYLKGFLESEMGKELLNQLTTGSIIPNISMKDLRELKIPKISIEKQDEMENIYKKHKYKILEKEKELEKLKEDLNRDLSEIYSKEEVGLCD